MPRPVSLTDAIELARKCGLLDDGALRQFLSRTKRDGFGELTPEAFFAQMVADELLTPFQARQLTEGRWRGLVLGNYHLQARIGKGGMGQVFRGEHVRLRRPVAIKVLNTDLADDAVAIARLQREARATATLDHPNIVKVFDIDAEHAPPYLVMEYVDGLSLQAIVALTGTLCVEATALCGRQIASGLAHAAAAGLVHRDIKPANLLLDRLGVVKILDLGIVLLREDAARLTLTSDGQSSLLGTVDYLAPEQALDSHRVDGRADIYALGGTLYFLLAGHPPFDDVVPHHRLARKQTSEPEPIHRLRPDVPEEFSAVIARMLARDPADRYQSALDVADALAAWAVPVTGFPEDLFAQVPGQEWSGVHPALAKSSVIGYPAARRHGHLRVNGNDIHAALAVMLTAEVSPADLALSLADTAPSTALTLPPTMTKRMPKRRMEAAPPSRRWLGGLVALTCLLIAFLGIAILLASGAFAARRAGVVPSSEILRAVAPVPN